MDRNELKTQALLEKISSLTTSYENQCADYRVEITMMVEEMNKALAERDALRTELEELKAAHEDVSAEEAPEEQG